MILSGYLDVGLYIFCAFIIMGIFPLGFLLLINPSPEDVPVCVPTWEQVKDLSAGHVETVGVSQTSDKTGVMILSKLLERAQKEQRAWTWKRQ